MQEPMNGGIRCEDSPIVSGNGLGHAEGSLARGRSKPD